MRPKTPAGGLGVDYGDFFPQDGEGDVEFVNIRYFGQFSSIYFPILILFLLFQVCIGITVVRGRRRSEQLKTLSRINLDRSH